MARLRYNGLRATLGASLTESAASITFAAALTHSNGTAVPTLAAGDYIPLVILDASGHESEIVWLTAYTSGATTGTISRGQEGTTGVTHNSGDAVIGTPTVEDLRFVGVRVYNSANIAVSSAGMVLTFDSERFDTDGMHSTTSNTSRLTATVAGKYHISGTVLFANNVNGARGLQIQLNGTTFLAIVRVPTVTGTDTTGITINTIYDLAVGDYVELFAYQGTGSPINILAGAAYSPEFMMHKVG
jgi:hypothetical protein